MEDSTLFFPLSCLNFGVHYTQDTFADCKDSKISPPMKFPHVEIVSILQ